MTISNEPKVHFWRPTAWLRVSGPEAFIFLQGQLTNDLGALKTGPAVYGLWLNQKGRVLADSFVLRGSTAEEFWVCSYFCPAAVIRERLESHIIADDVTVVDESMDWFGATLVGADLIKKTQTVGDGIFFPGRRGLGEQVEWMTRTPPNIAEATVLTAGDMEHARIREAIPAVPVDIGPGELPNEGGLEADAISYNKGCYLGQEVIARLKSMGQVRRRLLQVAGSGMPPACPAKLYQGARQVGELRSTAAEGDGFIGLALLTLLHLQRGIPLSLAPDAPPAITLVTAL
jgi:folate-binding protein YgfZ